MKKYDVIGLMSGTSLDGLDIAFVRFFHNSNWGFQLLECSTFSYSEEMRDNLKFAGKLSGLELKKLDREYGNRIGVKTKEFMDQNHISPELIVSHGHTVFHQPEKGITLQIGSGYEIMLAAGIKTICDLRSLDVALGGQGAPLVPIGDKMLFGDYEMCLNLGGFSNISFDTKNSRNAFDICPVNTVLNYLASLVNLDYDIDGKIAETGKANLALLEKLNALAFYKQKPPKSLGMEWVNEHIIPLLAGDSPKNLLNTFCLHITRQIVLALEQNYDFRKTGNLPKVLVTGGGAKNCFLIKLLKSQANGLAEIVIPDNKVVDFKEAIIFAFLGLLRSLGEINTLSSVTGAKIDSSGGIVYDHVNSKSVS